MKIRRYPDTDTLYIELIDRPGADVIQLSDDVVVDVDADGMPVGIEIEHASHNADLPHMELEGLSPEAVHKVEPLR